MLGFSEDAGIMCGNHLRREEIWHILTDKIGDKLSFEGKFFSYIIEI